MKKIAIMSILGLSLFSFLSLHQAFAEPQRASADCPRLLQNYNSCMQSDRANRKGDACQAERNTLFQNNCPRQQSCRENAIGNMLFCPDHRTVYRHQVCRNGRMVMEDVNGGQANCPGQAAQQAQQEHPQNCVDPDHSDLNRVGQDRLIKSTTSGWLGSGRSRRYVTREDKCSEERDGFGNQRLTEYTCFNGTEIGLRTNNCLGVNDGRDAGRQETCYDGACWGRCTDSDNTGNQMGEDRFVNGQTQVYVPDFDIGADRPVWTLDVRNDACLSEHELTEYYCEHNVFINSKTYQCPANERCDDGKCVSTLPAEINSCNPDMAWNNGREYYLAQDLRANGDVCFAFRETWGRPVRDIVFDCRGHQITCGGEIGTCLNAFYVSDSTNITIKNCTASNFNMAFFILNRPRNFTLLNNTANNSNFGFYIQGGGAGVNGLNVSNNRACNNFAVDFDCSDFSGNIQQGENNTFGRVERCRRNEGWPFGHEYRPCP